MLPNISLCNDGNMVHVLNIIETLLLQLQNLVTVTGYVELIGSPIATPLFIPSYRLWVRSEYNSICTKTLQLSSPCCRCTALPVLITLKTLSSTPYFNKQALTWERGGRCGWRRGWRLLVGLIHSFPNGNGTIPSWFWKQRYNHNIAVHHIYLCFFYAECENYNQPARNKQITHSARFLALLVIW